jgi:hypothetical protein
MRTLLKGLKTASYGWLLTTKFEISSCHIGVDYEFPSFEVSYRINWFIVPLFGEAYCLRFQGSFRRRVMCPYSGLIFLLT